jgi:hypothetical protein
MCAVLLPPGVNLMCAVLLPPGVNLMCAVLLPPGVNLMCAVLLLSVYHIVMGVGQERPQSLRPASSMLSFGLFNGVCSLTLNVPN